MAPSDPHQIATRQSTAHCQVQLSTFPPTEIGLDHPTRNQNTETKQDTFNANVWDFQGFVAWTGAPSAPSFDGFEPIPVRIKRKHKRRFRQCTEANGGNNMRPLMNR